MSLEGTVRTHVGQVAEGYANDADHIEFRYGDAKNPVDLRCGRMSVPGTWLTVSHISARSHARKARTTCSSSHSWQLHMVPVTTCQGCMIMRRRRLHMTARARSPSVEGVRARSKLRVVPMQREVLAHHAHAEDISIPILTEILDLWR